MTRNESGLEHRCRALTEELGMGNADSIRNVQPLTGGVASDIARVELADRVLCMKFARERLKVAEDWRAPVHRSAAEYAWLEAASAIAPASVPRLQGHSTRLHGFAMEFITGPHCCLWKQALLDGRVQPRVAAAVGSVLGSVHAISARDDFDTHAFRNSDDFHALRLEPYLLFTATRHPALATALHRLADQLHDASRVLVHGDVSPKNILLRGVTPVLLDAECATMGDASFDVAFCVNHLLLKAIHRPDDSTLLLTSIDALWQAYRTCIDWESVTALETRVAALLPALMLARVDGKSPVDYLSPEQCARVRRLATGQILRPASDIAGVLGMLSPSRHQES